MLHKKKPFTNFDPKGSSTLVFAADSQNEDTKLSDFCITGILGQGAFGKVYLGELPDKDKQKYAIKSIRKDRIIQQAAISSTFTEL